MSPSPSFASASGLRPMSAFVVVGVVLFVVAGWLVEVNLRAEASQPERIVEDESDPFPYSIQDGTGRTLARFVPRFDLEMSPRSMWQAHTPARMAHAISDALGGAPSPAELLDAMLPDAVDGVIHVEDWELTPRQALRLQEWIDSGGGSGQGAIDGLWVLAPELVGEERRPRYHVAWRPEVLLSEGVREEHGYKSAWAWGRALAYGIDTALGGSVREEEADGRRILTDDRRDAIWDALFPTAFTRPIVGLSPERALELRAKLSEEGVAPWQMKVAYARDRHYPSGTHQLFGSWGWLEPTDVEARPREGLELLCQDLLQRDAWSFLTRDPAVYTWLRDRTVRGQRANGYLEYTSSSTPPVVHSTIQVPLQRFLRRALEDLRAEHDPALALAIVLEVESGNVLAVDAVQDYEVQPFAPLFHAFTPGSTMKIMTMAAALETGAVTDPWTDKVDVGPGWYSLRPLLGCSRTISEAQGSLKGYESLADFFARSTNAAMVQVGARMDARSHRAVLAAAGYGRSPEAQLGPETSGYLPPLPWTECYTKASISFGHEMTTSLWQHAQAIAAIVRGGVMRPLRVVDAIEQDGVTHPVPLEDGARIFSAETAATIRALMEYGAETGTGRKVRRDDLVMGTKTGTAQKVSTELCLHVELAARNDWEERGVAPTRARIRALKSQPKPHSNCYTSSMAVFGSVRGATGEDAKELLVLVVADEPRSKKKFGSDVAGPAAVRILVEALGLTQSGAELDDDAYEGFGFAPGTAPSGLLELDADAVAERVHALRSTDPQVVDLDVFEAGGGR